MALSWLTRECSRVSLKNSSILQVSGQMDNFKEQSNENFHNAIQNLYHNSDPSPKLEYLNPKELWW